MPHEDPKRNAKGQFAKGVSGNPGGKVKWRESLMKHVRNELEKDDGKLAKAVAKSLINNAIKAKGGALKELFDRVEGPVAQRVVHEELANHVLGVAEELLDPETYAELVDRLTESGATRAGEDPSAQG